MSLKLEVPGGPNHCLPFTKQTVLTHDHQAMILVMLVAIQISIISVLRLDTPSIYPIRNSPKHHRHARCPINLLNFSFPDDGSDIVISSHRHRLAGLSFLCIPPVRQEPLVFRQGHKLLEVWQWAGWIFRVCSMHIAGKNRCRPAPGGGRRRSGVCRLRPQNWYACRVFGNKLPGPDQWRGRPCGVRMAERHQHPELVVAFDMRTCGLVSLRLGSLCCSRRLFDSGHIV